MSIKRILAAAAASVVAVSALTVAASADALLSSVMTGDSGAPKSNRWKIDTSAVDNETLAKGDVVVATVTSTAFVNGGIGADTVNDGWQQNAGSENSAAGTSEWKWEGIAAHGGLKISEGDGDLQVQLWWQNVNDDGPDSTVTIDKVELLDASGAVLYTFGGGAAAPAEESKPEESKTEESKTETENKPNVDTGVEGVAAVVGVAAVAVGALVVAKKRK